MGLSNADEARSPLWAQVAAERARGKTFLVGPGNTIVPDTSAATAVMFSRDVESVEQLQAEQSERERLRRENPNGPMRRSNRTSTRRSTSTSS